MTTNPFFKKGAIDIMTTNPFFKKGVVDIMTTNPFAVNTVDINSAGSGRIDTADEPSVETAPRGADANNPTAVLADQYERSIPAPLTHAPFCLYKLVKRDRKKDAKIPLTVKNGKLVELKVNQPEDALDFTEALDALRQFDDANGIGIVLSLQDKYAGIAAIDIDHCFVADQPNALAAKLLQRFDGAYIERSVSGTGLHIIYLDQFTSSLKRKRNDNIGLEIYNDLRFIALTADVYSPSADMRFDGETNIIVSEYLYSDADKQFLDIPAKDVPPAIDTDTLLNIIRQSKHADKFNRLFNADISVKHDDWSRADFALCLELAFWTNGNFNQIRDIWAMSKLAQRNKFLDRQGDYDSRTITNALQVWCLGGRKHFTPKSARSLPTPAASFDPVINIELPHDWNPDFTITCPAGFAVDQQGISFATEYRGRLEWRLISHSVILVKQSVRNVESGIVSLNLTCLTENGWINLPPIDREVLASNSKIVSLSKFGLDIRSDNAGLIAKWIADFIADNHQHIRQVLTVDHIGWQHDGSFVYPNSEGKYRLVESVRADAEKFFASEGDKRIVTDILRDLQCNDIFFFTIGAALAAPIIKLADAHANIALHLYGNTGCGKSTVAKFAFSLFGNPNANGAIPNADTTRAGIENVFDARRDMPTFIEDIDSVNDEKTLRVIQSLPYQFVNTAGRTRAHKDGGNRQTAEFRGSLITTGEHPITSDTSRGGGKRRLLEIFVPDNFLDTAGNQAARINRAFRDNFGLFGQDWINVISNADRKQLRQLVNDVQFGSDDFQGLTNALPNKIALHVADVAVIAVALTFFRVRILGDTDFRSAMQSEYQRALRILQTLPDQSEIADWQRAKQFIIAWIVAHPKNFDPSDDRAYEVFGEFDFKQHSKDMTPAKILTTYLNQFLADKGFDPKTVIKQLADNDFIQRCDSNRIAHQVRFNGGRPLMYIIPGINICPPEAVKPSPTVQTPSKEMLAARDHVVVSGDFKGKRLDDLTDDQLRLLIKDTDWSYDYTNAGLVIQYRRQFKHLPFNELEHVDDVDIPF